MDAKRLQNKKQHAGSRHLGRTFEMLMFAVRVLFYVSSVGKNNALKRADRFVGRARVPAAEDFRILGKFCISFGAVLAQRKLSIG